MPDRYAPKSFMTEIRRYKSEPWMRASNIPCPRCEQILPRHSWRTEKRFMDSAICLTCPTCGDFEISADSGAFLREPTGLITEPKSPPQLSSDQLVTINALLVELHQAQHDGGLAMEQSLKLQVEMTQLRKREEQAKQGIRCLLRGLPQDFFDNL